MREPKLNTEPRVYRAPGPRRQYPRRLVIFVLVIIIGVTLGAGLLWVKHKFTERFDLLIVNGLVIDGTGSSARREIIGVRAGKIVPVRWPRFAEAERTIDARDLVVAPGFIDVHTHIEGNTGNNRKSPLLAPNFIAQGITTIITGNCGRSARSLSQFFAQLESRGLQINVGSLVGHNTIRREVMKETSRAPTGEELARMRELVAKAMRDGAFGLSTGLEYAPGTFADQKEIEALAVVAARHHGIYATHLRDEGNEVVKSLDEALSIARGAQIPLEVSHLKWRGRVNWGKSQRLIDMLVQAANSGLRVHCDAYPYTSSSTTLDLLLPKSALEGGTGKLRERLRDAAMRRRILDEILSRMRSEGWEDFSFARVAYCDFAPEYNGLTLPEIALLSSRAEQPDGQRKSEVKLDREKPNVPKYVSAEKQAEAICNLALRGSVQMIYENMSADDVTRILLFSGCMLGSDSNIRDGEGRPHPRGYGSTARVLSVFARERGLLSMEEAIRRMTSLPAETFGIAERGQLLPGYWADIVIFAPSEIKDRATYENPFRSPDGIQYVLVNGQMALDHGSAETLDAGRVIKHELRSSKAGNEAADQ